MEHKCEHHHELTEEQKVRQERKEYLLSRVRYCEDFISVRELLREIIESL